MQGSGRVAVICLSRLMFERYTEQARRALFFARYETSQVGGVSIEAEHLLVGLTRERGGLTNRIFEQFHLSPESLRNEVESLNISRDKVSTSVEIPFSGETKRILQHAADEADLLGHRNIGTEHLLLGILREEHSAAATVLIKKGLTARAARDALIRILNE
jgi:ATP-dependent Clp protease ATP-binding subunit ClpC